MVPVMAATFLYSLAGGMMLVLATGRPADIAWKFLRLCGFLMLGLLAMAGTMTFKSDTFIVDSMRMKTLGAGACAALCAAVLAMFAPLAARLATSARCLCLLGGCAALAASIASVAFTQNLGYGVSPRVLLCLGNLTAALLLGAITVSWLLGHAYLTATKMTIAPLRHFSRMLTWAVIIRAGFVAVSLMGGANAPRAPGVLSQIANNWLVAVLRGGLGLIAVGIFAYMVADCVRRRATQSATGILYFGSLFAYVGELAALHLTREIGWPM